MFHVEWLESALDELALMWLQGDSQLRAAITSATNELDRKLTADPYEISESRPGARRITFEAPLGIIFRIENEANVVVLHVWQFGIRPTG